MNDEARSLKNGNQPVSSVIGHSFVLRHS